ncbi:MAG: manganese efflux pump MntP family protein, partial [Chloroflexota bacterium]
MDSLLDLLSLLLIAVGLSVDCFAVAVSTSVAMPRLYYRPVLRTAFAFGLSQFVMPLLGWLAGRTVVGLISAYDHWVAFFLLGVVGARMIWESLHSQDGRSGSVDATRGILLLTLSVATSIDALAVGLSFAFLKTNIMLASATIGTVAFLVTILGFVIGRKVSGLLGRRAKLAGGIVLLGIGLRILLSHLLS